MSTIVNPAKKLKFLSSNRYNVQGKPKKLSLHRKSKHLQRWFVRNPWIRPLCVFNFAAIKIQQYMRGYLVRRRIREYGIITNKAAFKHYLYNYRFHQMLQKPNKSKLALKKNLNRQLNRYLLYLDSFRDDANNPQQVLKKPPWLDGGFSTWCTVRIQAWWRMLRTKARYGLVKKLVPQVACIVIQTYWRNHFYHHKFKVPYEPGKVNSLQSRPNKNELASVRIQRAWRAFCNKRIFRYLKSLILKTFLSIPVIDLLRYILPNEMHLLDRAAGVHLKFRLGGIFFPPKIYFKIFTHRPLCDINAFAPRDYTKEKPIDELSINTHSTALLRTFPAIAPQIRTASNHKKTLFAQQVKYFDQTVRTTNPDGTMRWYSREENNAWRPIALPAFQKLQISFPVWLQQEYEYQQDCLVSKPKPFHFSSVKRKLLKATDQKKRKREWMLKLYLSQSRAMGCDPNPHTNPSSPNPVSIPSPNNTNRSISPYSPTPGPESRNNYNNSNNNSNKYYYLSQSMRSDSPPANHNNNHNSHSHKQQNSFYDDEDEEYTTFLPPPVAVVLPVIQKQISRNQIREEKGQSRSNKAPQSETFTHPLQDHQLVDWSLALNFDDYLHEWNALGTSLPTDLPTNAIIYRQTNDMPA